MEANWTPVGCHMLLLTGHKGEKTRIKVKNLTLSWSILLQCWEPTNQPYRCFPLNKMINELKQETGAVDFAPEVSRDLFMP